MATIRKLSPNKFRTEVHKLQSTIKTKTFPTRLQAEKWENNVDNQDLYRSVRKTAGKTQVKSVKLTVKYLILIANNIKYKHQNFQFPFN